MQRAAILVIGNEILSGRTRDANIQFIGEALAQHGIRVCEVRVVEDRYAAIVAGVNSLRASYDLVFTTGGIGPTHDDITTECIAAAVGRMVVEDPDALRRLTEYYAGGELNTARRKMAHVVAGCSLLDNPVSGAPGYRIDNIYVLPGVPRILQAMLPGVLANLPGGPPISSRAVTAYLRESEIATELAEIQARYPMLDLGSYPFARDGRFGTSLVVRGTDAMAQQGAVAEISVMLARHSAEFELDPQNRPQNS